MEDKTFELMEKMYAEINKRFDVLEEKIDKKADKTDIIRIENVHGKKIDALFDGYKQLYEKLEEHDKRFDEHDKRFDEHDKRFDEHDKRFDRIEAKLDNLYHKVSSHDAKLEVLEGGRKK
ncbi:MAG: hypothetical protein QM315_01115 [Bacillota bacterium]|nr:hypothetical protein [Bacillota bacterium]NLV62254.1 hypothetical protein [Clostridiaceae bacterium]